jgi:hypothetical protein
MSAVTATRGRSGPGAAPPDKLADGLGWALIGVLTLVVLLSWAPSLWDGLGDDHEGRILGRHALHVQNAQQDGLAASGWLSDWSPYSGGPDGDQRSYSHHPPLMNVGYYVTAQVLPVPLDVAVRLFAYLSGVALLPLGAAVLRRLGFAWLPVLAATVAVAVTPLFWAYGRLNGNVSLLLAMVLVIVRLRERRPIGIGELVLGAVVSFAAVLAGYLGLATAAVLGLWLLAARGFDRVTVVVGTAMGLAAAITAAYVVGGTGPDEIGEQVRVRTQGGDFTVEEFVERIGQWLRELLPAWWRWGLAPLAVLAGLLDRRCRVLVATTAAVAVAYVVGLPNGSFVHDYWIFPVLLPVWFGTAALLTHLGDRAPRWRHAIPAVAAGLLLVVGFGGFVRGEVAATYASEPRAAGTLVRDTDPADGQTRAWHTGLAAPRWLSFYWNLPPGDLSEGGLGDVADDELVLVRTDRLPDWLDDAGAVSGASRHERGRYALLTGADLRELAGS